MRENDIVNDPNASEWLRSALRAALECDAVRVANDVEILRQVLHSRVAALAEPAEPEPGPEPAIARDRAAVATFPLAWIPGAS